MLLPKYIIDAISQTDSCPLPCGLIIPNGKLLENAVYKVKLALRADYPEITEITFYLFSDEEGDKFGIDGVFQYLGVIKPVIGVRASCFDSGSDKQYQIFLLLHECAHRLQPVEDAIDGELPHDKTFHNILDRLIGLFNKRFCEGIIDFDSMRQDGKKAVYKH